MSYRDDVVKAAKKRPGHPLNHGIDMQAHHLVSRASIVGASLALVTGQYEKDSLGGALIALGYNIDALANVVLLPCTLPGACHLHVQLHRGNHTSGDDDHPVKYHIYVAGLLATLRWKKSHGGLCKLTPEQIQHKVDRVSARVLKLIALFILPLTKIHESFRPLEASGCCGVDAVPEAAEILEDKTKRPRCPVGRHHGYSISKYKPEVYSEAH